jgi:uncharacterized protein
MPFAEIGDGLPAPETDALNQPYWDGASRGAFVISRCRVCGEIMAAPVSNCRRCLAADFDWIEDAGTGRVVSYITYHRPWTDAFRTVVPYTVVLVQLDSGPRTLMGLIEDADSEVAVDGELTVAFQSRDGVKVPMAKAAPVAPNLFHAR